MEQLSKKHFAPPVNGALNPTGWYYERSRKKYHQEQVKLTKGEKDKFALKFPKNQIITKEKLAKHIYCIECKPHIVAKGANYVMKDFGAMIDDIYKKTPEVFNDYYFKRSVAATIIFNTVDRAVANAPWYQAGGYKLNIVPYTISKIISSIPLGYSIDWLKIWQKQTLSLAFIREIEIVSKITNDFILESHGVIVTEYCKKEDTWKLFKDSVHHKLSDIFINELVSEMVIKEQNQGSRKEEKQYQEINAEIQVFKKGAEYWQSLLSEGKRTNTIGFKEESQLAIAANMEKTGIMPTPALAKAIIAIEKRLNENGVFIS